MIDYVVDTSALVDVFLMKGTSPDLRRSVMTGACAAPELLDLETANVLRKMVLRDDLAPAEARETLRDIRDAPILRVAHRHLVERVWELRHNVTIYDASYVALAEKFDVPLLTSDARLGRSVGHDAEIVVYPSS
ncbi:MAG: type II toxin-antitoxin system VapC family toxin [Pseudonocardia sp.]|nr:type II toxin-antitoxin system VapC family toxin [Pseudonocardia sp.]